MKHVSPTSIGMLLFTTLRKLEDKECYFSLLYENWKTRKKAPIAEHPETIMGFRAHLLTLGFMFAILVNASCGFSVTFFTVDFTGVCREGPPPPYYGYDYTSNARVVGTLSGVNHVLFGRYKFLYVVRGSELYGGPKPSNPSRDWFQGPGRRVGKAGWDLFKRLFFDPITRDLYAVTDQGELYAGPPPMKEKQVWKDALGKKVGYGGWDRFVALFFDPQGILHAVTAEDRFVKGSPPRGVNDNWIARSQAIKAGGWINLSRFMSFTPDGNLWCVSISGGWIYTASPPTWGDNWIGRAQNRGQSNLFKFMDFTAQ